MYIVPKVMDPLWIDGVWKRGDLYSHIRSRLGYEFHTSHIKTIEEARIIYKIVKGIADASIVAR